MGAYKPMQAGSTRLARVGLMDGVRRGPKGGSAGEGASELDALRRGLRFEPAEEMEYLGERIEQYLPIARPVLLVAVVLYCSGVWINSQFFDRLTLPWIQVSVYALLAPITLLAFVATYLHALRPHLIRLNMALGMVTGPVLALLTVASPASDAPIAFFSLVVHYLYLFFLLGVLYWQAVLIATVSYVFILVAGAALEVPPAMRFDHAYFLSGVIFIGGLASYLQERAQRLAWQRKRQLEHLSDHDRLTGLLNHAAFFERAETAVLQARRDGKPVAALFTDIDHFKRVNDTLGHAEGDACLRRVAATLRAQARRPLDIAGRVGGEEFAVLLYDVSMEDALAFAETLRRSIEAMGAAQNGAAPLHVTLSIGVATLNPGGDTNASALFRRADAAMYRAKSEGRNRVRIDALQPAVLASA